MRAVLIFIIAMIYSLSLHSRSTSFFEDPINYWPEEEKAQSENTRILPEQKVKKAKKEHVTKARFNWKVFENPKNDEFYRRGKHMPPRELVEVMKNPTDRNLKRYYELEEKRDKRLQMFIEKSEKYRMKNIRKAIAKLGAPVVSKNNFYNKREMISKYRIRTYFKPGCPSCRKMYQNLLKLSNKGFNIELVQVDDGPNDLTGIKSRGIRMGEGQKVGLFNGGVPYTLIINTKIKKVSAALRGYASMQKLTSTLK